MGVNKLTKAVVVHQQWIALDCNYLTEVRIVESGKLVWVRFPHKLLTGETVELRRW